MGCNEFIVHKRKGVPKKMHSKLNLNKNVDYVDYDFVVG